MSVKKQETPAYDPRGVQGIGLNYATNNRGGDHVRGYTIAVEVLGNPSKMDPHVTEGKANLGITFQNLTAALDSSGACLFSTFGIGANDLSCDAYRTYWGPLYHTRVYEGRRTNLELGENVEPESWIHQ